MYPLGTWFVSGICVWIPCIKETMMMIIIIKFVHHREGVRAEELTDLYSSSEII
jgi:hypothetical protein